MCANIHHYDNPKHQLLTTVVPLGPGCKSRARARNTFQHVSDVQQYAMLSIQTVVFERINSTTIWRYTVTLDATIKRGLRHHIGMCLVIMSKKKLRTSIPSHRSIRSALCRTTIPHSVRRSVRPFNRRVLRDKPAVFDQPITVARAGDVFVCPTFICIARRHCGKICGNTEKKQHNTHVSGNIGNPNWNLHALNPKTSIWLQFIEARNRCTSIEILFWIPWNTGLQNKQFLMKAQQHD